MAAHSSGIGQSQAHYIAAERVGFGEAVGQAAALYRPSAYSSEVGQSTALYRPVEYTTEVGQSVADYLPADDYSATYYDAADAPIVRGDIPGTAVRLRTLDEGHLKPIVALFKSLSRQRQAVGDTLAWSLPANRPQAFEMIDWRARATATSAGVFVVTLAGDVILSVPLAAGAHVRAVGVLLHVPSNNVMLWSRAMTSAGVLVSRRVDLVQVAAPRSFVVQIVGGVVRALAVTHAGRAD
jgi:hypothetical protein